jgi:biotin operon repressor
VRYDPSSVTRDVMRRQLVRMMGELWDGGVSFVVMAEALGISRQAVHKLIATEERLRG